VAVRRPFVSDSVPVVRYPLPGRGAGGEAVESQKFRANIPDSRPGLNVMEAAMTWEMPDFSVVEACFDVGDRLRRR
jgi:hypothetical protein